MERLFDLLERFVTAAELIASSPRMSTATVEPVAVGPEAVGPEAVEPVAVGPEAAGPEAVGPEAVGPEAVGPEAVRPEAVGPEAVGPEAVGPEAMEIADGPGTQDRGELVRRLHVLGVEFPSRTRTTTLLDRYLDLIQTHGVCEQCAARLPEVLSCQACGESGVQPIAPDVSPEPAVTAVPAEAPSRERVLAKLHEYMDYLKALGHSTTEAIDIARKVLVRVGGAGRISECPEASWPKIVAAVGKAMETGEEG